MDAIMRADDLQNITKATRISGVSPQTIYRNRKILKEREPESLKHTFRKNHYYKNRAHINLEKPFIEFSLANSHLGQTQISLQLNKLHQIEISILALEIYG